MNIKKYLKETLGHNEILDLLGDKRIHFLHANNPTPPYLEYEIVNEYGAEYSEGNEQYTTHIVQLDIFSKSDYTDLENIVKNHMINNGFNRDMAADTYEKDTKLYHKAMRFNISLPIQ